MPATLFERTAMGVWVTSLVGFSVFGNTFVLISSFRDNSIILDCVSLALIRNIAVIDLAFCCILLTNLTSILYNGWVLGSVMCDITSYLTIYFGSCEILSVCALNFSKMTILMSPLRARGRTTRSGVFVCIMTWVFPLLQLLANLLGGRVQVFKHGLYRCVGYFRNNMVNAIIPKFNAIFFICIPFLLVICVIVFLLCYLIFKRKMAMRQHGVAVLLAVSFTYFITYFPFAVYQTNRARFNEVKWMGMYFQRFATMLIYVNFSSNPLIYFLRHC